MDHLATVACINKLQVTVYLTTAGSVQEDDTGWFHRQIQNHDADTALRTHSQFMSAFRSMRGIRDFFVKLEWGWRFYAEQPGRRDSEKFYSVLFHNEIDMLELSLERMIMGNEYNPDFGRKLGRKPSVWLFLVYDRLEHSNWSRQLHEVDTGHI
ncbi:hypothetical protein F4808DRAFT_465880 [Astrocystis sublimbata]|nr:hypothetical protein F4808DRAFT_466363 [Astrocystis sublimbata]KAI0187645.1 hypothetical protein F4808DRAFT_466350 [Astrocystis sublimbata]KAI0189664.1 hypothetical protein F4808DRAFT_465859 [Astrocystis sublimbata]KAI0189665.1 hypothetical protein F4808DRAFT_465860 [Astrocystis sublimbata]KAI0189685.1 hypothetical protein F4808DRAFT_465879 [Astrocystis sublimbata]